MIVVNVRLAPDLLAPDQGVLKAALNVVVADERILESPEDPTGEIRAQIGLYAHRGQGGRGLVIDPGA
jgi:hypothetical protein